MSDTDAAEVLYFSEQLKFCHDALEDYFESIGFPLSHLLQDSPFLFVIVHAESEYKQPIRVGDELEIVIQADLIGHTSFAFAYQIIRGEFLVGRVRTVHVCVDSKTRAKCPIPAPLKRKLSAL